MEPLLSIQLSAVSDRMELLLSVQLSDFSDRMELLISVQLSVFHQHSLSGLNGFISV